MPLQLQLPLSLTDEAALVLYHRLKPSLQNKLEVHDEALSQIRQIIERVVSMKDAEIKELTTTH